jgi:release factor glutamine methyltransferase
MFDLIVSNPPWVPSVTDVLPQSGMARAWDAGRDGRALIDPICAQAPGHLRPAGVLLLLQPMVCDTSATVRSLTAQGLNVTMAARLVAPMTPLLRERAQQLHERCPWGPDDSTYEISVIRAARPAVPPALTKLASRASSAVSECQSENYPGRFAGARTWDTAWWDATSGQ